VVLAATVAAGALLAAGGSSPPAAAASAVAGHTAHADARYRAATPQSEATALRSADWMSNVTTSLGQGSWTFESDGVPPSTFVASHYAVPSNPDAVSAAGARIVASSAVLKHQDYDYTLPLTPEYSKTTTTTNQGPIGVALDGAAFYNPYEANHSTVATADNFVTSSGGVSASFLDDCDGHPGPGGQYHYHGLPACLVAYATGQAVAPVEPVTSTGGSRTAGVSRSTPAARKPVLLGFAFDGYGIYDNVAMDGKTVPVSALDACNGIFSAVPGYPHGVYHYVLENVKGARADIGCYHGVVSSAYTTALRRTLGASGGPPANGGPTGDGPPGGAPGGAAGPAGGSPASVTAYSLRANAGEDTLLRADVAVSVGKDCGSS
jgi:YHYH protein